jgi:hypothetical protein
MIASLLGSTQAVAQQVLIPGASPDTVMEHLKARLLPQGFVLESANAKNALFTLDRGLVSQRGNSQVPVAHIVIELQVRFKQKKEGLSVALNEDVVGERGRPLEFRRPAVSERGQLQQLLDAIRAELQAAPSDSAARADSSKP